MFEALKAHLQRSAQRATPKNPKVAKSMQEFAAGELHSGSKEGPLVTNPAQAAAIGYSEQRAEKKRNG